MKYDVVGGYYRSIEYKDDHLLTNNDKIVGFKYGESQRIYDEYYLKTHPYNPSKRNNIKQFKYAKKYIANPHTEFSHFGSNYFK